MQSAICLLYPAVYIYIYIYVFICFCVWSNWTFKRSGLGVPDEPMQYQRLPLNCAWLWLPGCMWNYLWLLRPNRPRNPPSGCA